MAKSHYSFKKRKKELERKMKQEEKRQRRFSKNLVDSEENADLVQVEPVRGEEEEKE